MTETARWHCYEVTLEVFAPDVFAWGYLLVPRDLKAGERRPVVVCQHGLEGLPATLINTDPTSRDFATYNAFAAQLADLGFVTNQLHSLTCASSRLPLCGLLSSTDVEFLPCLKGFSNKWGLKEFQ